MEFIHYTHEILQINASRADLHECTIEFYVNINNKHVTNVFMDDFQWLKLVFRSILYLVYVFRAIQQFFGGGSLKNHSILMNIDAYN